MNIRLMVVLLVGLYLVACQQQDNEVETQHQQIVRSVKLYTIVDAGITENRVYPGKSSSASVSELSFPVSEKITEMLVSAGDSVTQGQVLAKLDDSSLKLDLEVAQAEFLKAKADFNEKQSDYNRKLPLAEKGWITKSELEQSEGAMKSAKQQMKLMLTKISLAKKNITDTIITAPFSGTIGERAVELYEEVAVGQKIFTLEGNSGIEVKIDLPERELAKVKVGTPAQVEFKALGKRFKGKITEIGSVAGPGNLFEVKVGLLETDDGLRSGMSTEVKLNVEHKSESEKSYLIPLTALVPGDDKAKAYVYIYKPETSTVQKRAIGFLQKLDGNLIAVSGVKTGDRIVSAGVSFLTDGLKVKPYKAKE